MKLEVLLSVMNLDINILNKMNITSKCIVINQCGENNYRKYKNFNIYSYDEIGVSNSRNRGLEHISEDIILLCDDDVVYNDNYEKIVLDEFKNNPKADVILFNVRSLYRKKRVIKKSKRLHIYNSLSFATYNIAFRRKSVENIRFNILFGPGAKYNSGEDSLFIRDLFKNKLNVFCSPLYLGIVYNKTSTWFKGYNELYFFNKGALFTAINRKIRYLLMLQYLLRHKEVLVDFNFFEAYIIMLKGSINYLEECNE